MSEDVEPLDPVTKAVFIGYGVFFVALNAAIIHHEIKARRHEKMVNTCFRQAYLRVAEKVAEPGSTLHDINMAVREENAFLNAVMNHDKTARPPRN